jgi:hypothetical protein
MNQSAATHNSFLGLQSQLTGLQTLLSRMGCPTSKVESELVAVRSEVNSKFDRDRVHEDMQAINNRAVAWCL